MSDQILLYDQALLNWIQTNLVDVQVGKTVQVLVATAKKSFAEVNSGRLVDERTLRIPRISVQRLDLSNDSTRYNANKIRKLGYCNIAENLKSKLLSANYPAPVIIPYQIDLWSKYFSEMNIWERSIAENFASTYQYLRIRPNDVWGWKSYPLFWDGSIADNSDLEPGEGDRQLRKTVSLKAECWLFADSFIINPVVKRIEVEILDKDDSSLYDRSFLPPLEIVATGNGVTKDFSFTIDRPPIVENTIVIQTVINSETVILLDNGVDEFVSDQVASSSIDYTSGEITISFVTAPDASEDITATYFSDV